QAPGKPARFTVKVGKGPGRRRAILAFPYQCRLCVPLRLAPPVEAVHHHVRDAAHAPPRKRQALACVQYVLVWRDEAVVEKTDELVMKPGGIGAGALVQLLETANPQRTHEVCQIRAFESGAVGPPHGV